MKEFAQSTTRDRPEVLRQRLSNDGYLFFRSLLPIEALNTVRKDIIRVLLDCQWIDADQNVNSLSPGPNAAPTAGQSIAYYGMYTALQATQSFHELAVRPELTDLITAIFDEPIFAQPLRIGRIALPDGGALRTRPHQDLRPIQGTRDALTAWIPLTNCPAALGGLAALAGSNAADLLPASPAPGPGGLTVDVSDTDEAWRTSDYTLGDVLLFHSLTVHQALPNKSNQLRLSVDFRYQPASDPVTPLALRPHHYPIVPDWPTLTRAWSSLSSLTIPNDLKILPRVPADSSVIETPPSRFAPQPAKQ